MADYYTPGTPAIANTLARAETVAAELVTIQGAFNKIPEQVSLEQDRAAYALDTGVADAYLVAMPSTWTAYTEGASLRMKAVNANTGASTINVDGLGVKLIKRFNGDALSAADIPADSVLEFYFDGVNFQLAGGPATITNGVLGPASSTDNAVIRFNGTTGKSAQNSGVTIDDSNVCNGITKLGVGGTLTDGTLHVITSTGAGSVTAATQADDVVVENNGDAGVSILAPDADISRLVLGSPGDAIGAGLLWDYGAAGANKQLRLHTSTADGIIVFQTGNSAEVARFDANGTLFVGDNANANMTVGLTIEGGANDNQHFCLKNSDVQTEMTTGTRTQDVETDDFFTISKASTVSGGTLLQSIAENPASATRSLIIESYGGEAGTDDVTTSLGLIDIFAAEHDGAATGNAALVNAPAEANLLTIASWSGGAKVTRFLLKGDDGELHLGNATTVALDDEDDVMRTRELQSVMTSGRGIVPTAYDLPVYKHEKLHQLGLVGDKDAKGEFLIRVQPILGLLMGSIWQLYNMVKETEGRLVVAENTLAALPQEGPSV